MIHRIAASALLMLGMAACAPTDADLPASVRGAAANYPPMVLYGTVHPTDGKTPPRSCPVAGVTVDTKGGPNFVYGGADPSSPDLCLMTADGQPVKAWYGIWLTDWPGVEQARPGLQRLLNAPSGTVVGFDVTVAPGRQYHDLMRAEGQEDLTLFGTIYRTIKISHYREGYDGNNYRSVATVWKDIPSGAIIYATYDHISGAPVIDDPLIPTALDLK